MRLLRRMAYWLRFRANGNALREELAFHRDRLAADFERNGLTSHDAMEAAHRAMGNETYMRENARAVWLAPTLDALLQDWRYAARGLRRSPAFTIVAVLSLALGIGANTAIFGMVHALLLARLPIARPSELVQIEPSGPRRVDALSRAEFDALSSGAMPLTAFSTTTATLEANAVVLTASVDVVDGNYFDLLGVHAARGRMITTADDADAAPVAVLTDRFWRGRLKSDSSVLGQVIKINGHPFAIVGITPPGFGGLRFPAPDDALVPYRSAEALGIVRRDRRAAALTVVGRRPASQSLERAREPVAAVWKACCATGALVASPRGQPALTAQLSVVDVSRGIEQVKLDLRGRYGRILLALMAGVGVLLLAACVNVANLLLARSSARMRELAVRTALGASRTRLIMQLGIESLQLTLLGALVGVGLARWGTAVLERTNIGDLTRVVGSSSAFGVDVLSFTIAVSIAAGLVFGIAPAVRVVRTDLNTPLKQGARNATAGRHGFVDRGLVALQMALALLLVSGAALLVQTLRNLESIDLGFDPSGRLVTGTETRRTAYQATGMTAAMTSEMLRGVGAVPGVRSAAFASWLPIAGGRASSDNVTAVGAPPPADGDPSSFFAGITPGYFASLGIPLLAGRDIDPPVSSATPLVTRNVVINTLFAAKFFPGRNPIGQIFQDSDEGDTLVTENHVIGVIGSAHFLSVRAAATPMYFVPVEDHEWPYLELVIRPSRNGLALGPAVERAIAGVAPGISQGDLSLLSASIDDALARERTSATLAVLFGAIALGLVAVGLYGVMLYQVTERTTEIGIRMALGADAPSVMGLVLRQSLAIVGVGLIAGVPLALLAGRAVASQLYGVRPYDALTLGIAGATLVAVALAASLVPVRRAVGVDPLTALRAE